MMDLALRNLEPAIVLLKRRGVCGVFPIPDFIIG